MTQGGGPGTPAALTPSSDVTAIDDTPAGPAE
jgi:hypothetical protein